MELEAMVGVLKVGLAIIGSLLTVLLALGGVMANKIWAKLEKLEVIVNGLTLSEVRFKYIEDELKKLREIVETLATADTRLKRIEEDVLDLRKAKHEHGNFIQGFSSQVRSLEKDADALAARVKTLEKE